MISLNDLHKTYRSVLPGRGSVSALSGVSLDVAHGEAIGIVGLNGAGKSTLLKVLLGYLKPTSGSVEIEGVPPRRYVESNGIAFVPERPAIRPGWTVEHALRTFAMLGELGGDAWEQVDAAMDRLGIGTLRDRPVGRLSKGNLQRVAIAQALLGRRKVMILDEPTDGLDPVWIAELRLIVRHWREEDPERVLIIASHNLGEVQRLTDRVVLLHEGRVDRILEPRSEGIDLEMLFLGRLAELQSARS